MHYVLHISELFNHNLWPPNCFILTAFVIQKASDYINELIKEKNELIKEKKTITKRNRSEGMQKICQRKKYWFPKQND